MSTTMLRGAVRRLSTSLLPRRVRIYEVGARDGLQNEPTRLDPSQRIAFCDLLSRTGAVAVEAAAFVDPRRVPQMDGSADVMHGLRRHPGVEYPALAPNLKGFEAAIAAGASSVAVMTAASETFSRNNVREDAVRLNSSSAPPRPRPSHSPRALGAPCA